MGLPAEGAIGPHKRPRDVSAEAVDQSIDERGPGVLVGVRQVHRPHEQRSEAEHEAEAGDDGRVHVVGCVAGRLTEADQLGQQRLLLGDLAQEARARPPDRARRREDHLGEQGSGGRAGLEQAAPGGDEVEHTGRLLAGQQQAELLGAVALDDGGEQLGLGLPVVVDGADAEPGGLGDLRHTTRPRSRRWRRRSRRRPAPRCLVSSVVRPATRPIGALSACTWK